MSLTYIPPYENPWMRMLPNLISSLAMQKISQNFQAKQAEIERTEAEEKEKRAAIISGKYEEMPITSRRDADLTIGESRLREIPQRVSVEDIGGQKMAMLKRGSNIESMSPVASQEPYKPGTIQEWKVGDQFVRMAYLGNGQWQPMATGARYKPITNVNVDLSPKTRSDLEEEITRTSNQIATGDVILERAKKEYFQVPDQLIAGASKAIERGFGVKWKTKFQADYYSFWKTVRQESLKERKFFTGVAGGEKEMADIEATTPSMKDSYSTFVHTINDRKILKLALLKRTQAWLNKGIDLKTLSPEERKELLEDDDLTKYGWFGPGSSEEQSTPISEEEKYDYEYVPGRGLIPVLR